MENNFIELTRLIFESLDYRKSKILIDKSFVKCISPHPDNNTRSNISFKDSTQILVNSNYDDLKKIFFNKESNVSKKSL